MDRHGDRDDYDDAGGDLCSEDGDNGLRSSMNFAGLSMSSLQSELHIRGTSEPESNDDDLLQIGGDEESEDGGQDEDRDSQGRLRLSMIMSKLSDDEEDGGDGGQDGALGSAVGGESEHLDHGGEDDHDSRDEESGGDDEEPNGEDSEYAAEDTAGRTNRDDLVTEAEPEQLAAETTREDEEPRQSSRAAHTDEKVFYEQQLISRHDHYEDAAAVGEPLQVPQLPVGPTQSHARRSEREGSDAAEPDSKKFVQVQPLSKTSPAAKAQDAKEELRGMYEQSVADEDARVEVRTQSVSDPPPAQVKTEIEVTGSASQQAPPTPVVVDFSDGVAVLPLPPELHPTPSYKIRDLFPVVYEKPTNFQKAKQKPLMTARTSKTKVEEHRSPTHPVPSTSSVSKTINSATKDQAITRHTLQQRIQSLHKQLEITQGQLKSATQSIKMHQVADAERKQLQQRNVRIKQQLDALTADLQRTKAENAKLHAENELFAAKLPHLQAELLQEACQADEKQAQAVQLQLMITQLKARVHVLQTRNGNLETQHEKMQLELRECKKELRRKASTLLVTTEKLMKLEADVSNLKNVHAQELQHWKTRLSTAVQRFELEKAKQANEVEKKIENQLNETKNQAASASKRKRELEVLVVKLEVELKARKREVDLSKQELHKQVKETLSLEKLLKKAHRAEATLRNEVALLKTKLCVSIGEQKKQGTQQARRVVRGGVVPTTLNSSRLHGDKLMYPLDLLLLEVGMNSDDDGEEASDEAEQPGLIDGHCECCALSLKSSSFSPQQQHDVNGEYTISRCLHQHWEHEPRVLSCEKCVKVKDQLQHANAEIHRLRLMHADELKVQASAYNYLLKIDSSRAAAAGSSNEIPSNRRGLGILDGASTSA